jgi:hypothetical protein
MTETEERKALSAPPRVTAVVVRNALFEAQIGEEGSMQIHRVGPQGGRTKQITLTAPEASALLDLVAHGRATLEGMRRDA